MLDLNQNQINQLTIWAYDKLWNMLDNNSYDGDNWFTVNNLDINLDNKIDINIYDSESENGQIVIKCAAYEIIELPDGYPQTKCDNWIILF